MSSKITDKTLIRFDWAIKRILRNKANFSVVEGFLSVLLQKQVKIISINESESNTELPDGKTNRVDILVEDAKKQLLIIEIQNSYEIDYYLRMLYGVSKAVAEHLQKGDRYANVRKVYHINIIHFKLSGCIDYVYHGSTEFRGLHHGDVLELTGKQKKFFSKNSIRELYPEYYILCACDFNDVALDNLDEWIFYLKNNSIPDSFTAQGLKEAREQLLYDKLSEYEKKDYDRHIDQTLYERNIIEDSFELGKEKGKAEGKAEGEKEKAISIAQNALKMGIPEEDIIKLTGLNREDLNNIQ